MLVDVVVRTVLLVGLVVGAVLLPVLARAVTVRRVLAAVVLVDDGCAGAQRVPRAGRDDAADPQAVSGLVAA